MNFNTNKNTFQRLLLDKWRMKTNITGQTREFEAGVYFITRLQEDTQYKMGMASGFGGLFERLGYYRTCMTGDNEFWVHYLVICPKTDLTVVAKNGKTKKLSHAHKMEGILGESFGKNAELQYSKEWYVRDRTNKLQANVGRVLNNNRKYWTYFIKFYPDNSWKVFENDGHSNVDFKHLPKVKTPLNQDVKQISKKEVKIRAVSKQIAKKFLKVK